MITKAAINLLSSAFTRNGFIAWSATDTDEGTASLWGELASAGFVEANKYKSPFGHHFSYRLTDEGHRHLGETYSPYDYPFFCKVCRNCFAKKEMLVAHHQSKHSHLIPLAA